MQVLRTGCGTGVYIELPDELDGEPQCTIHQSLGASDVIEVCMAECSQGSISRETVRSLIPHLQAFVDTGSIQIQEPK